jgi:outer membrane protein assembly factor BamB
VAANGIVYGLANRACAVRTNGKGDVTASHLLWEVNQGCEVGSPIFHQGHLYWADENGICHCLDAKDGRVVYKERLQPAPGAVFASGIVGDGKIYYVSRENGTYVIAAQPSFKLLAHNKMDSDTSVFNASPAVSRGQLLLRSDRFLYCIGVK